MERRDQHAGARARAAVIVAVWVVVSAVAAAAQAGTQTRTGDSRSAAHLASTATKITPKVGPPRTTVTVNGSGFAAGEPVDVYFDTADLALSIAGAEGRSAA